MNFNKFILPTLIFMIALLGISCQDFLSVNKNPNVINEAPEPLRLAGLLGNFSYETIANDGTRYGAMWMQQIAFNGTPPTEDNYDINGTDVNGVWTAAYSDVMVNAKKLDELAMKNGNYAYSAIAKTILAWAAVYTSNLWGDIPFSQALQPEKYLKPKYDSQESVYKAAQSLLDSAIVAIDKSSPLTPAEDDLLYGGDLGKWKRLIYTLKARFYINLSNAPGYSAEEQAQKALNALENGFQSNDDDADFAYYNELGSENPWYQWGVDGKWFDEYRMSKHYVDLLQLLNDPRLAVQARPNVNGVYRGHENGEPGEDNSLISEMGVFYASPGAAVTWISYAEALFIKAEATFILNGAAAADPIYRDAIRASMNKLGVDPAERDAYIANQPTLTNANGLEDIMTQKYIANFLTISAYNDWRRTGYPELTIIDDPYVNTIPLRFVAPTSELDNNLENLEATGIPLGQQAMTVPVWWDSK
ncbi:MAG TPA: SusD/RagB family nutrient-binding outer membrane lipoprotein [Balneolaceae bacterium]